MIGLALVTVFAVLAQGLRGSDRQAVRQQVTADYVVQADGDPGTLPTSAAAALPSSRATISAVRYDRGVVGTSDVGVNGVDSHIATVMRFDWTHGSDATITSLSGDEAVLPKSYASNHHLELGDRFTLMTAAGMPVALRVAGIYDPPKLDQNPRRHHDRSGDLRPEFPAPAGHDGVGARNGRQGDARVGARGIPLGERSHPRRVHRGALGLCRQPPEPRLRAPRAFDRGQLLRQVNMLVLSVFERTRRRWGFCAPSG